MTNTSTPVGFIGLGLMGLPIALKLLQQGQTVHVWGRSKEKLAPALEAGAHAAASPATMAADCDIVILCVTDTKAVEAVVFGTDGIAEGAHANTIILDHSSIEPAATIHFAENLRAKCGAHWIDAPVSGGAPAVESQSLVVMAGGAPEDFARVQKIAQSYAGRITLMGPQGAGQTTKLINQTLVGVNFALLAEVVTFAANAGIDAGKLPAALAGGRADSRLFQEFLPRMLMDNPPQGGRIDIVLKDLDMVNETAKNNGTAMPLTSLAANLHRLMVAKGFGGVDNAQFPKLYTKESPTL